MLDATTVGNSGMQSHNASKGNTNSGEIKIIDVSVTFGEGDEQHQAVHKTSLTIEVGQFVCILGPSGVWKIYVAERSGGLR